MRRGLNVGHQTVFGDRDEARIEKEALVVRRRAPHEQQHEIVGERHRPDQLREIAPRYGNGRCISGADARAAIAWTADFHNASKCNVSKELGYDGESSFDAQSGSLPGPRRRYFGGRPALGAPAANAVSGDPYEINVILSLTGGAAFLGKAQQQALGLIQQIANRNGGIKGRPLSFAIVDDQSSPQLAVQLANAIIAKKVPIFIGSDLTAPCAAIGPLVEKNGPVEYCTSPGINPAAGGYIFSASASTRADAIALVRYYRERGWTHIGLLTSTDASGQAFEDSLQPRAGAAGKQGRDGRPCASTSQRPTSVSRDKPRTSKRSTRKR